MAGGSGGHQPGAVIQDQSGAAWRDDDEIDLFELWDMLWEGRWFVVVAGAFCTIAAVIIALRATPIYESRVTMVPAEQNTASGGLSALAGQFGGLASMAGINLGGGGGQISTAVAILNSFAFKAEFIKDNNLMPVLFPNRWNKAKADGGDEIESPPSLQEAVQVFGNAIVLNTDKATSVTTLAVAWTDPVTAANWANGIIAALNQTMRQNAVDEAQRAESYLRARIAETANVDMVQTLYRMIEAQTKTIMLANARDEYVFRVVDPAIPPEERSKPRRGLIVVLGGLIGGMLGVVLVFARRVVKSYRRRRSTI